MTRSELNCSFSRNKMSHVSDTMWQCLTCSERAAHAPIRFYCGQMMARKYSAVLTSRMPSCQQETATIWDDKSFWPTIMQAYYHFTMHVGSVSYSLVHWYVMWRNIRSIVKIYCARKRKKKWLRQIAHMGKYI